MIDAGKHIGSKNNLKFYILDVLLSNIIFIL